MRGVKKEVDFVHSLQQKIAQGATSQHSLKGLSADLGVEITEGDIIDARREMWGSFPREDF